MPFIRPMKTAEIAFGLELCRIAGWNQLEADWRRLLALAPEGVFVSEEDGVLCGTASAVPYGRRTAWIGMVLVHPDFRRRGIGTALMNHCIAHLQSLGIESIKLDATDQGRPVYAKLGFRVERPSWRLTGTCLERSYTHPNVRSLADRDWLAIGALDWQAFDADRTGLLRLLSAEGPCVVFEHSGDIRAYGFARPGYTAFHLGPIVALDAAGADAVVKTLLSMLPAGNVYWDVLPDNRPSLELAESLGFTVARRLTRMYLGNKVYPGAVPQIFGATSFELG